MKLNPHLKKAFDALCDLFYPPNCIGCGDAVQPGDFRHICGGCRDNLHLISAPACLACGAPFYGQVESLRHCPNCRELEPLFVAGKALVLYRGVGSELIRRLKYNQAFYLLEDIRRLIRQTAGLREYVEGATIVPVPLHARRQRERGFNQSRLLAECLAGEYPGARVAELLVRKKDTPSQTHLTREQRQQNVRGAFALAPKADAPGGLYILVDDVLTTGATLNECARVLLHHQPDCTVKVLALGHG